MNQTKLLEEAASLICSMFEEETEDEENKVVRTKEKDGKRVDVVSVEDELFPKDGTAKQQYNQKIIDKINDIIEGKATLEDLIQLVRQKRAYKKREVTSESLSDAIKRVEDLVKEI